MRNTVWIVRWTSLVTHRIYLTWAPLGLDLLA
jgi:hypothetical protein